MAGLDAACAFTALLLDGRTCITGHTDSINYACINEMSCLRNRYQPQPLHSFLSKCVMYALFCFVLPGSQSFCPFLEFCLGWTDIIKFTFLLRYAAAG